MRQTFVHLNVKSAYALCQSMLTVDQIAELCKRHDMPGIGIPDKDAMFGALELSEKLAKKGIHGIVALSVIVDFQDGKPPGTVNLYAMNEQGYRNLMAVALKCSEAESGVSSNRRKKKQSSR